MNYSKKIISFIVCTLMVLSVFSSASFAWLSGFNQIDPVIGSGVLANYFECGNVTKEDPFIIHTPRHMYNFAWLQYLGMFNQEDGSTGTVRQIYFELCPGGDGCHWEDTTPQSEIDMTGWTLPPVGTAKYPFLGHFDGKGVAISNLTVSGNYSDLTEAADNETDFNTHSLNNAGNGCNTVGLFGVVGTTGSTAGTWNNGSKNLTYDTSTGAITITDVIIKNETLKTPSGQALAGFAAGYVNAVFSDVRVVGGTVVNAGGNSTATNLTSNLSDYGVAGYCAPEFRDENDDVTVTVYDPQYIITDSNAATQGQGNNWGNSVEMREMYNDLLGKYNASAGQTSTTYASEITETYDKNGVLTSTAINNTASMSMSVSGYPVRYSNVTNTTGESVASYSLIKQQGTDDFVYLYGEHDLGTATQTVHRIYQHEEEAFYIYSGSNYLCYDGNSFTNTTNEAQATKWVMTNSAIYTIRENAGTYTKHYLLDNNHVLASSAAIAIDAAAPSGASVWTIENDKIHHGEYYLTYHVT